MENKLYFDGKEVAVVKSIKMQKENFCSVKGIYFYVEFGDLHLCDMNGKCDIIFEETILKNCVFGNGKGMYKFRRNDGGIDFGIGEIDVTFLKQIKKEDHQGKIYNPYNDSWSWI